MAHAHGGSHGGVRLHRVFLQSAPAPLGAPLSQSSTVRKENPQPDHRGLTVTCPRKRGNSKPLVEAAEINIGQQWTQYTALRSTLFGPSEKPCSMSPARRNRQIRSSSCLSRMRRRNRDMSFL